MRVDPLLLSYQLDANRTEWEVQAGAEDEQE